MVRGDTLATTVVCMKYPGFYWLRGSQTASLADTRAFNNPQNI